MGNLVTKKCIGCLSTRENNHLVYGGDYHYDCKPCLGCGETREGYCLIYGGKYHYDCKPCQICHKAFRYVPLIDGKVHQLCKDGLLKQIKDGDNSV